MRTKVTLVLIFLNVALFFFIFYLKSNIHAPTDHSSILGPEVANIQSIEISGAGRTAPIRIEKRGENWALTQPLDWPANGFAVNAIVNELQQLRSEASFAVKDLEKNGQSLADYGLEKPPLTVTIVGGGSGVIPPKSTVLQIGDTAKVGNRLYILSPDRERVHVVHRSLAESLLVKLDDLRSNTIFSIEPYELHSLNLQDPTGSKVRIAHTESKWVFETPIAARANKNAADVTISQLDALRIGSFTDQRSPEALKLTPEEMTLRITLEGDNRRETLIVGARLPEQTPPPNPSPNVSSTNDATTPATEESEVYYAKMEDKNSIFTVSIPRNLLETLRNAQEKLRDRQILDVDPGAVSSVTLTASGQPDLTLQRLETNSKNPLSSAWQLVRRSDDHSPQTLPADREIVDQLIQHLCQLSALKFEADAPIDSKLESYGFTRPARLIRIALAPTSSAPGAAPSPIILKIGIGEDRHVYAKLDTPNYVYLVSDDILQQTPVESLAYRERVLRDLPAGAKITALKLVDLGTQTVLLDVPFPLVEADAPGQTSSASTLSPQKRAAIESLAKQLQTLRAKRFVRDQFTKTILVSGEERPWKYQLTTTLSLVGGNSAQTAISTLFISEREGGNTQFIGAPDVDFNVVFTAEQPLIDALFAITYGPRDPGPTAPKPGSDN